MPYNKRFKNTLYNSEWLKDRYLRQKMSANQIAEELDCYASAVISRLKRIGVETRDLSESQKLVPHSGSHAPRPKKCKNTLHNKKWLKKHYVSKGMTASDIARMLDVSVPSVIWALDKADIPVRGISESKKGVPNPNRRVADEVASKSTRGNRANEILPKGPCVECGRQRYVAAHHINGDHSDNRLANLERLCAKCHTALHRTQQAVASDLLWKKRGVTVLQLVAEELGVSVNYFRKKAKKSLRRNLS